jgi:hypothetical protein
MVPSFGTLIFALFVKRVYFSSFQNIVIREMKDVCHRILIREKGNGIHEQGRPAK